MERQYAQTLYHTIDGLLKFSFLYYNEINLNPNANVVGLQSLALGFFVNNCTENVIKGNSHKKWYAFVAGALVAGTYSHCCGKGLGNWTWGYLACLFLDFGNKEISPLKAFASVYIVKHFIQLPIMPSIIYLSCCELSHYEYNFIESYINKESLESYIIVGQVQHCAIHLIVELIYRRVMGASTIANSFQFVAFQIAITVLQLLFFSPHSPLPQQLVVSKKNN